MIMYIIKFNTKLLFIYFLDDNIDYMFDTIFQLYYIFYGSKNMSIGLILLPVFK